MRVLRITPVCLEGPAADRMDLFYLDEERSLQKIEDKQQHLKIGMSGECLLSHQMSWCGGQINSENTMMQGVREQVKGQAK